MKEETHTEDINFEMDRNGDFYDSDFVRLSSLNERENTTINTDVGNENCPSVYLTAFISFHSEKNYGEEVCERKCALVITLPWVSVLLPGV